MSATQATSTHRAFQRRPFQIVDLRSRLAARYVMAGFVPRPDGDGLAPLVPRPTMVSVARDGEIVTQAAKAEYCYLVVTGCVRTVRQIEDGRRQIGEFLLPGDLFGWEAPGEHDFGAEAVVPTTLHRYERRDLETFADRDRDFGHRLRTMMASRVRAGRQHIILLGRRGSSERIACFLLDMAERMKLDKRAWMELPMGREDIADYLGLTIETVSRHLTRLRRHGTISVERAKIMICDQQGLEIAGIERATL
jgi:CRP-like cAMP-binding protein